MRRALIVSCVLLALIVLVGCPRPQATEPPPPVPGQKTSAAATEAPRETIMLYVPCGMIIPVRAVMTAFEKQNPGVKVRGVFDNSDIIVNRLTKRHEKADLVMTPGNVEMDSLKQAGVVAADGAKTLGEFELVVMAPAGNPMGLKGPEDLRRCKTLVSADPKINSIGASGKEALTSLGLWEDLQPKFVFTKHAIDAYTIIATGKADAGIAYRNCPLETNPEKLSKSKVHVAFAFPADKYVKQPCLVAQLQGSTSAMATKYLEFMTSPEGLKILADNGLTDAVSMPAAKAQ